MPSGTDAGQPTTCDGCASDAEKNSCASAVAACSSDPDCGALNDCLDHCASDDTDCNKSCWNDAPQSAADELDSVNLCICNLCSALCVAQCK